MSWRFISVVVALLSILLCDVGPTPSRARAQPSVAREQAEHSSALEDDAAEDMLVLALWFRRYILSDGFIGYRTGDSVFVPLGEMMAALEFPIEVQPTMGRAQGWFLQEERTFLLDLDNREVQTDGRRLTVDAAGVQIRIDDIYVRTDLLEDWFPVDLSVDFGRLLIEVASREPLPIERRIEREEMRARFRPRRSADRLPRAEIPYRFVDWPFMDVGISGGGRRSTTFEPDGQLAVRASGDLLGMSSGMSVFSSRRDTTTTVSVRGTVERRDPDGRLLGPLQARSVIMGDVNMPRIALVTRGESGVGGEISNYDLTQAVEFDRVTLRGTLMPGWDAELYRDRTLLDFQTLGDDGRYEFEDVPLLFGENELRLVFYGPQGQQREIIKRFEAGRALLRPGEERYRLAVVDAGRSLFETDKRYSGRSRDEGMRASVELARGMHRNLTVAGSWVNVPTRGVRHDYMNVGIRATAAGAFLRADASAQDGGEGYAFLLSAQTRRLGVGISAERAQLTRFVSDEADLLADPPTGQTRLRLDGTIPRWWLPPIALSVSGELERLQSKRSRADVSGRAGLSWRRMSLANSWRWTSIEQVPGAVAVDRVVGEASLSIRNRAISIRGNVSYDVEPVSNVRTVDVTGDWRIGRRLLGYIGAAQQIESHDTAYLGGLTWDADRMFVGVSGRYESADNFDVRLSLAFSVGRQPRTGHWTLQSDRLADTGALSARVFVDENQNGTMDDGELRKLTKTAFCSSAGWTVTTRSVWKSRRAASPIHTGCRSRKGSKLCRVRAAPPSWTSDWSPPARSTGRYSWTRGRHHERPRMLRSSSSIWTARW
jgi:hypothetical protein